jgi:urease accessory protein
MLVGGALGMAHVHVLLVEPGILASVVTLGLLVALAVDLPVWLGAVILGVFAIFHGHAHGSEVAENVGGIEYMAGLALATATLHLIGIGTALTLTGWRSAIRVAGAASAVIGVGLITGVL